jgi:hypothetical protein
MCRSGHAREIGGPAERLTVHGLRLAQARDAAIIEEKGLGR